MPITAGASPTGRRANTTRPSPTTPRPSGSTRNMPRRITAGATPTVTRANTTRPLPTTPRPSGWTRSTPMPIVAGACAYGNKGEYDKAIADYTEAIRLEPEVCQGVLQPWLLPTATRASTTRRLPTTPRPSGSTRNTPMAYYNRGMCLRAQGRTTTRRLPTTPRPSGSTRNMPRPTTTGAWPTASKGEYDKAIADYTEAIRLDPKDADAYTTGAVPTGRRASTTRPLPTSPRPSG